ncbi:MAG TPA: hypothetical protein VFW21_13980 [Mycobacterium sp.]|nr:hypothetical protein [Mycobacterium sp.]
MTTPVATGGGGGGAPGGGGLFAPIGGLIPFGAMAPVLGALAPVTGLAAPLLGGGSSMLAPAAIGVPTVPGLPLPLPTTVSMPSDLVCSGTGWSATAPHEGAPAPGHGAAEPRRGDW